MTDNVSVTSETPVLPAALARSAQYDEWRMSKFRDTPFDAHDLNFLLTTVHAELFIGLAFVNFGALELEVSVVEKEAHSTQRRRKPLSYIPRQFAVLRQYARAGFIVDQFQRDEITWLEFKVAVVELMEGEAIQ